MQGTPAAFLGNRSARACKEASPFTRVTIHLSSSFGKHVLMLSMAPLLSQNSALIIGAALFEDWDFV